ncbi:MAG: ATP-binding protein [Chitinophagales bacterium]
MINTIIEAESFVTNLKRSDNWVSNDELITKLKQCYQLIQEHEREDLIPVTCVHIALCYIDLGEYGESWHYTETAKSTAEFQKNFDAHLNSLSLQYRIQRYFGNLDIAQELVNCQIEIALQYNNAFQLCSAYLNQALQYFSQNIMKESLQAFEKAVLYALKHKDEYYLINLYINYSGVLIHFAEYKKATSILKIAFNKAKKINNLYFIAFAYSNFALLNDKQKIYDKAINFYLKSIKIFSEQKKLNEANQAKLLLSETYLNNKDYSLCKKTLNEVHVFSEKNNIKTNLNSVFLLLSMLSEQTSNYKDALFYFKKHKVINEEIYNIEANNRIKNLEILQKINILNVEKNSAVSLANLKHDFLANMSHEIRTPINSILGICYLLEQQQLDILQQNYINRLKRNGENLLSIVNDVLDISKIESGKMELAINSFSLNALIQDILNTIEPTILEKNIRFIIQKKYNGDIKMLSDRIRIQQVLLNILYNAVKFTMEGTITLRVKINQKNIKNKLVIFEIIDTGIGIDRNKLNAIFNRYEQATPTIKTTFGGTGLGLSITQKIIELMNGNIKVKSQLGTGSHFIISVPFKDSDEPDEPVKAFVFNAATLANKKIIIADDNLENRLIISEILGKKYQNIHSIFEAGNGTDVLRILRNHKNVDLLLLDMDMPQLNGIETIQKIRKNKEYKSLKVIGHTASLSSLSLQELIEFGFDSFIYKPFKVEELLKKIEGIFRSYK